jgi:hypothetical protein
MAALVAAVPGASPTSALSCAGYDPMLLPDMTRTFDLIVIGRVTAAGSDEATMRPEAYLKGPADGRSILFAKPAPDARVPGKVSGECPLADLDEGDRVLAFIVARPGTSYEWPGAIFVAHLEEGDALVAGSVVASEDELVEELRGLTGQYAVPAGSEDEGAGIDWVGTVLPVGGALAGLMVVGLLLMRVWHRIDPS